MKESTVSRILACFVNNICIKEYWRKKSKLHDKSISCDEIEIYNEDLCDNLKEHLNINDLTVKDALDLGFTLWDNTNYPNLYLIPFYILPLIPIGTELTSIFGKKFIYDGHNIDLDTRFGCIAYGIYIKDEEEINND